MLSRSPLCLSLLGLAVATLVACGSPAEDEPREPRPAPPPEAARSAERARPVEDPASVARLERVRTWLEEGLDVDQTDAEGRTLLMMAAFDGYTDVVELLLSYGAEVDRLDGAGRSALMFASTGPFPETVELLIDNGARVDLADKAEGWTALMVAAAEGHQPVVEALLHKGADVGVVDQDGDAAVDHARERGQSHIVNLLESWSAGPGENPESG